MSKQVFVVAGARLAGAKAAQALREQGFEGRMVLVGAEPERPYLRPGDRLVGRRRSGERSPSSGPRAIAPTTAL